MPDYERSPATLVETIQSYFKFAMHVASYLYMAYYVNVPKLATYLAYTTVAITGVGEIVEGWKIIDRICHKLNKMF